MSQTVTALLRLRELILSGEIAAGDRLSELAVVERLGVSRTPVRAALARLSEEGLAEPIPSGGYAVRGFTEREIDDAIELRGTIEGLAARFAAERGAAGARLAEMRAAADAIDGLLANDPMDVDDFSHYVEANAAFHTALALAADSAPLLRQIERVTALPFASPSGFVMAQAALPTTRSILLVAQDQHRCLIDAIERGESTRAEAIAREHSRIARRQLRLALMTHASLDLVPGSALIERRRRARFAVG